LVDGWRLADSIASVKLNLSAENHLLDTANRQPPIANPAYAEASAGRSRQPPTAN